jgi:hypothetical protein
MSTLGPMPMARTVTFTVQGLSTRDETLFRSFVRLLAHRTQQVWKPTTGAPDVLVVPQEAAVHQAAPARCVLVVGATPRNEAHFLRFPFHAEEMEAALNRAGCSVAVPMPVAATLSTGESTLVAAASLVKLLRWPPAHLLGNVSRVRLATLLRARAWSSWCALWARPDPRRVPSRPACSRASATGSAA